MKKKKQREQPVAKAQRQQRDLQQVAWLVAERQLHADLRQIAGDLMKLLAMLSTLAQQVQEASERYRKQRES